MSAHIPTRPAAATAAAGRVGILDDSIFAVSVVCAADVLALVVLIRRIARHACGGQIFFLSARFALHFYISCSFAAGVCPKAFENTSAAGSLGVHPRGIGAAPALYSLATF